MADLHNIPVTVVGASRGLGRVIAETFHRRGAKVLVTARGQADLDKLARDLPGIATLACDAAAPDTPERVFAVQVPRILVLCGGAMPVCKPFPEVDWDEFSRNWNNDTRMSFHFLQAVLKRPLPDGTTVVSITSGAIRQGSPISGGYAGAKQMQVYMNSYAQKSADRAGLGVRFLSLAPAKLMPQTDIGKAGVKGYAAYNSTTETDFLEMMGQGQSPQQVADAVVALIEDAAPGGNFIVSHDSVAALS